MVYKHLFRVKAPLASVARFHADSSSMGSITPPPVIVRVHSAPALLGENDRMDFTLWLLLLPLHWVARIQDVSPRGFTDVQLSGPFESWQHHHEFCPQNEYWTEVHDTVQATLSRNPVKWLIGLCMWISLPVLFAFRGWKTRRILDAQA
jgi:ligand-binding SRPBCC domain-containing protein